VTPAEPPEPAGQPVRRGLLAREWPVIVVLLGVLAGLVVVGALDRFRRGSLVVAAFVVLAAWLRALLTPESAGTLVVRSRAMDVTTLLTLGIGLTVLALVVPA
jgi:amino acid permease